MGPEYDLDQKNPDSWLKKHRSLYIGAPALPALPLAPLALLILNLLLL